MCFMREYSGAEKKLMEQLGIICHNSNKSKNTVEFKTNVKGCTCLPSVCNCVTDSSCKMCLKVLEAT